MRWGYFLSVLFIIMLIPLVLSIKNSAPSITGMVVAENVKEDLPEFKTYTKAVCEKDKGFIICKDELFANCNGYEFIVPREEIDPIRCGSLVFKIPENKINGIGIFEEDWKDPRNG